MSVVSMSMGAYDEDEHERREKKNTTVETDFDDERSEYRGELRFDSGESAEALLDQFRRIKSN